MEKQKENYKNMVTFAYYGAVFQRNKHPESDLDKIMSNLDEGEEMTPERMLNELKRYVGKEG